MVKNYVRLMVALVFATNLMAQNVPNYVPTNGLVGWWPFNGNANDESGNGNNGTVNGATLTADRNGKVNSAYSFDGINDYIVSNGGDRFISTNQTISFWVFFNDLNSFTGTLITLGSSSSCMWGPYYNNFQPGIGNGTGIGCGGNFNGVNQSLNNKKWYNITIVSKGTLNSVFLDGNLIGSNLNTNGFGCSSSNLYFAVDIFSVAEYFNGLLDDIAIYNRALSQQEIEALYTGTPFCTNPTAIITPQGNPTFCQGGFVNLNASTGANYTYEWYNNGQLINGATASVYQASASGNYTVKVIDGVCNATSTATTVTVNPLPNVTLNALNQFTLKNASPIQLVANPTGGTFSGEGVQGATFTPANVSLGKKTITYNYTSPQGCSGKASSNTFVVDSIGNVCNVTKYDTVKVTKTVYDTLKVTKTITDTVSILKVKFKLTTGIKANQYTTMNVYPNPTSDVIIIDASDVAALNGYSYKLFDAQGKEVYNALVSNVKTEISMKTFGKAGVYILHVVDANNVSIETKQIVLE